MATTNNKKRRKTKHRGNAAGFVEARGRTSAGAVKAPPPKGGRGAGRRNRFDEPPTWSGAATRAFIAALLFVALVILAFGQPVVSSITLGLAVFFFYIPLGFYTDRFFFNKRQKKLGRA